MILYAIVNTYIETGESHLRMMSATGQIPVFMTRSDAEAHMESLSELYNKNIQEGVKKVEIIPVHVSHVGGASI